MSRPENGSRDPWLGARLWRYMYGPPTDARASKDADALRIGIVCASKIAPTALVHPAMQLRNVIAAGVAGTPSSQQHPVLFC